MLDPLRLHRWALANDFGVFFEKCFATLEPQIAFQDAWYIHAVAEALRKVSCGETTRLIVNIPPRSGKSMLVTVAYTAWLLGTEPWKRIICVSYSESLAKSHARAFRTIVGSTWFRQAFPAFKIARNGDRSIETITTQHGYRYAVSISGPVLGRGADLIIADDAMSPMAAFSDLVRRRETILWDTAHRTRLNNKSKGAIISVSQRLHEDDLVGHVMQSGDWSVLAIPAIAPAAKSYHIGPGRADLYHRAEDEVLLPEREPREVLDEMRAAIGSMNFSAQYMQNPLPPGGNVIKRDWLKYFEEEPAEFDRLVASWDTASTLGENSSYSVGTLWGAVGNDFYLLALVRGRWEAPELRQKIIRREREWQPDHSIIEDTELGRSLVQDLRLAGFTRPRVKRCRHGKEARLLMQSARFEAGQVHLPAQAPWLEQYESELLGFPYARNDDQVDSTSQALDYLTSYASADRPRRQNMGPRRGSRQPRPRANRSDAPALY